MTRDQAQHELAQPLDVAPSKAPASPPLSGALQDVSRSGLLLAALGAIAFSGKAIMVKLGYRHGADAVTLLALRMLVAFPFFMAMGLWAAHRAESLSPSDRGKVVLLGVLGYYLASFLDFAGLAYVTATLERLILYLTPTLVALIGLVALKRRITQRQVVALLVSYAGVAIAFGHDLRIGGAGITTGSLLIFGSALSYALYLVGSGELVKRVGAVRLTAYASSVACVLCLGQFVLLKPLDALMLPREVYVLSLVNGTLCTVLPVLAVMMSVARIGSALASQVGMIGPVSTIVLSMLLLGEPMGPWQVVGTLLVMAGVYVVTQRGASR